MYVFFSSFPRFPVQRWFRIGSKDVSKRFSRTGPKEVAKPFTLSPSQSDRKTVLTEPVSKRSHSFDFLLLEPESTSTDAGTDDSSADAIHGEAPTGSSTNATDGVPV